MKSLEWVRPRVIQLQRRRQGPESKGLLLSSLIKPKFIFLLLCRSGLGQVFVCTLDPCFSYMCFPLDIVTIENLSAYHTRQGGSE